MTIIRYQYDIDCYGNPIYATILVFGIFCQFEELLGYFLCNPNEPLIITAGKSQVVVNKGLMAQVFMEALAGKWNLNIVMVNVCKEKI